MKGYSTKQILDPNFWMPNNREDLVAIYRTLAKSADQRLVRLEAYEHDENFKTATKWAYARAMHDIQRWSGSEADRFNTAPPETDEKLISKIQDIKHFLESPSSTKKGIISVYKNKADALNASMKRDNPNWKDLKWQDLAGYFESSLWKKLNATYGSDVILQIINSVKNSNKKIKKDIEENRDVIIKVQDEVLQPTINKILDEYSDEVKELLK